MAEHDGAHHTPLKTQHHFRMSTLITFPKLAEEILESTSMLREEFEKTGTIKTISFDELYN